MGKARGYAEKINDYDYKLVVRAALKIERIINHQLNKDTGFKPEIHIKRLTELAAEDFGVKAEDVEKEYLKRHPPITGGSAVNKISVKETS